MILKKAPKVKTIELDPMIQRQRAFLLANNDAYEYIVKKIKIKKMDMDDLELVLSQVSFAAHFATRFHPGKFADGTIENIALEIGRMLPDIHEDIEKENGKGLRRILHVASQVQKIGGHSRMIYNWIECDKNSYHSLAVLNQEEETPIPKWLSDTVQNKGNLFVFPQGKSICEKVQLLRNIARKYADLVVLHIDGYEVIPTAAFAVDDCPPVALVNHFDHHFWLGSSVIDVVIDLRRIGADYTSERRYVSSNYVLPIPLVYKMNEKSRYNARRLLGIPEDQVVMISIGRAEKYWPYGPYDFVSTSGKILVHHDDAHIYVVGESLKGITPRLRCDVHSRLHFVGILEDPSLYRDAADIYLESFPYGTQTALLEAALKGLPVVPAYNPIFSLLVANDDALQDILRNPSDENEYINQVELLIKDPERRIFLGKTLQKRLLIDHVGDGWLNKLTSMYQKTDSLIHKPRHIPNVLCELTEADIGLSTWHVIIDNKTDLENGKNDNGDLALLWHIALLSEYCGDYVKAALFSIRAIFFDPRGSWRIFARLRGKVVRFVTRFFGK